MQTRLAGLALCALLSLPFGAIAGPSSRSAGCTDSNIEGCTRWIEQHRSESSIRLVYAYINRGYAYAKTAQFDQAIADYSEGISLGRRVHLPADDLANALAHRASVYELAKRFELAIDDCNEVLELAARNDLPAPIRVNAYRNRAFVYRDLGKLDESIADLDTALKLAPNSVELRKNRAFTLMLSGDLDGALAAADQAVRLAPGDPVAIGSRAVILRRQGELDRAIAEFNRAVALDPKSPEWLKGRGLTWHAKGALKAAITDFDAAIGLDPTQPGAYVGRGLVYEEMGEPERARTDFSLALRLPPHQVIKLGIGAFIVLDETHFADIARTRLALLSDRGAASAAPAAPSPQAQPASAEGRRIALVIGNGAYIHATPLPNPPNDARAIARLLRPMGFEVTEGIDLARAALHDALKDFLLKASGARVAVLFYAGHGMQVDGHNYLVPVDASFAGTDEVARSVTDLDTILAGLDNQIRTNIVILDACRNNPFAKRTAGSSAGPRSVAISAGLGVPAELGRGETSGAGTLLAFATAPGQVALDGEGDNSPFSTALIRHIATPGLEVQRMLTRVRAEVVASTRNRQVPWSNSSLLGETYLAGKP